MSTPGYVYILFNSAMPSLVKIGQTTRDPVDRAREIGGTGVPGDFVVAYKERVPDCVATEARLHRELSLHRYSPRREFFTLPLEVAIEKVRAIAADDRARARGTTADASEGRTRAPGSALRRDDVGSKPSWGLLSSIALLVCLFGALCTIAAIWVSIKGLAHSRSSGDAVAGVFASVALTTMCALPTEVLRRAASKLRSRGL